jgi:hypothetical protein
MENLEKKNIIEEKFGYSTEPHNHPIAAELLERLEKNNPEKILREITKKHLSFSSYKIVNDESQGDGAGWIDNEGMLANFNKGAGYVWLSIAHEMAHQFLQEKPKWDELDGAKEILVANNSYKSKEYNYTFNYAVEQTMACLLQAACEDRVPELRPLVWERWEDTFEDMSVKELAQKFWQPFLGYLKDNSKYPNIGFFILEVLKAN